MCLSIQRRRLGNQKGSRCLQLHTRLRGGVDGGGAGPVLELGEGYRGVTAGSGGGGRGRVGSYDLKKPFLWCVCQNAPQANTITRVAGSASWTNEGLYVEGRGFDVLGSWLLVFSLPLSFSACPTSKNARGVEKQMFWGTFLYTVQFIHPISVTLFVHCCCITTAWRARRPIPPTSSYPTKHSKSPYFIHIIIVSVKAGDFYLSWLPRLACLSLISAQSGCHYSRGGGYRGSLCVAMHVSLQRRGGEWEERKSPPNLCLTHGRNSDRKFPYAAAPGWNDKGMKKCKPEIQAFIIPSHLQSPAYTFPA